MTDETGYVPYHEREPDPRASIERPAEPPEPTDPGVAAVREYHSAFGIDPEWTVWSDRGFTWWPHRQAQRVWADGPSEQAGITAWRVNVETDLFRLPQADRETEAFVSLLGNNSTLNAFVMEQELLRSRAAAFIYEDVADWAGRALQVAGTIQAATAERYAPVVAEIFEGELATSAHPVSGPRTEPDEMVDAALGLPVPAGWEPGEEEVRKILELLEARGVLATGDRDGLVAEFPFGADGGPAASGGTSNLLKVELDAPHGVLGPGILMRLRLPDWPLWPDGRQIFPIELDRLEIDDPSGAYLLGGWWAPQDATPPLFECFVPAVLVKPGVLANLVMSMGARSDWASRFSPLG